ncbi:hypothetical protein GCM10028784_36990 [Myceligenerans cantabricum]
MLTVTDNARTAVEGLVQENQVPAEGGLRIAEATGQPGNFELVLVQGPEIEDQVVAQSDTTHVFVDQAASAALDELTLDVQPDTEGPGFVLVQA